MKALQNHFVDTAQKERRKQTVNVDIYLNGLNIVRHTEKL